MSQSSSEIVQQASAKHHGLPLLPHPTRDDKDPLRWPRSLRVMALAATAFVNFSSNFAGSGLSVASPVLEMQFHKSSGTINSLMTLNFLFLGIGNLFWVPFGVKYGKRAALLISTFMCFAFLIWSAKERSYKGLLAARCLTGFAAAAGESIVPSVVSDIFFLHERAAMMSAYTILITSATAIGPLIGSFIIQYSSTTWVGYMWTCAGLTGANLIAIFLLYPESNFHRPNEHIHHIPTAGSDIVQSGDEKQEVLRTDDISWSTVSVVQKSWRSIWTTFITVDNSVEFLTTFLQPFVLLSKPKILLAIYIYGTSLACQIILIFAFPSLMMAPPYLFSSIGVGLMEVAALVGFFIGCFAGGWLSDHITSKVIRKQNGDIYPEQRLISLIPGFWVAPAGCILVAFACDKKLHWIAIAFGFGMVSFGTIFTPNIIITYVVDSYPDRAAECLVMINVFKNLVAFLFIYTAVNWVASQGWIEVYMIMFALNMLGIFLTVGFYLFKIRRRNN